MSSCLHVFSSHPFFRLRAHWSRPERAQLHLLQTQALGGPGLYNEVGFHCLSLSTWFPFITTTYTFVPSRPFVTSCDMDRGQPHG